MNQQYYNDLVAPYKERQKKRLLIGLVAFVLGLLLSATGIGAVVCIVGLVYLMLEGIRTAGLAYVRSKCMKKHQQQGTLDYIMDSLQNATKMQVDGLNYAWTDEYLCLPHGVFLPLADIAWIFPFTQKITYMMIPVMRNNWCKIFLLDGTETIAFYGKVKDQQAFNALLAGLMDVVPNLLIGHTPENVEKYQAMVAAHRAKG